MSNTKLILFFLLLLGATNATTYYMSTHSVSYENERCMKEGAAEKDPGPSKTVVGDEKDWSRW